jgi:ribokinase
MDLYGTAVLVIGLGGEGALLAVREKGTVERFPAVHTRSVVSTIGAGDALFAGFLSHYLHNPDPVQALRAAQVFASYKIGEKGAATGFLTQKALEKWIAKVE